MVRKQTTKAQSTIKAKLNARNKAYKAISKAVMVVNQYIKAIEPEEFYAIEPDSSWECCYRFEPVKINAKGTSVITCIYEWNGGKWEKERHCVNFTDNDSMLGYGDARNHLNWIVRAIKKGYRDNCKNVPTIKGK